ncbi:unnamed protein product [Paramecium sonneborni]|uniref:Protein kinase domain-containing protein n=1 Tax=Paramecium sonneborni TaxID=65129 RepID=A0A8S1RSW7_9CILI|nr:unnamed protein product [Paramecium sonneborni]
MNCDQYLFNYKTLEETMEQHSPIKFHRIEKKHDSQISPYFILRETDTKYFKNEQHLKSMLNLKLFNILQPHDTIIHSNQILIIMRDWKQYRLTETKLKESQIEFILIQLAMTLNELSNKKITWNLYSLQQLYLIENCVFLQLIDLQDLHFSMAIPNIDIFKSFIRLYFPQFNQIQMINNFETIIQYLLSLVQDLKIDEKSHYGLNCFFKIKQINSSFGMEGNYSVEFTTPTIFQKIFNIDSKTILYRCYDMQKYQHKQLLEYQDREILITEKLSDTTNIKINFSYLRILDQTFFFQKKFIMSFADAVGQYDIQILQNQQYRKIAYRALNEIIKGIKALHSECIMHRNITPQTIYIDNQNLIDAHFYVGDQEKAKVEINIAEGTQMCDSLQFTPPESMENITMKSDLYQFGLVALYILNKGTPLFPHSFLNAEDNQTKFHPDNIKKEFEQKKFDYSYKLIELIAQCLQYNPKERPETNEVQRQVAQVYRDSRIRIIPCKEQKQLRQRFLNYKNDISNKFKQFK